MARNSGHWGGPSLGGRPRGALGEQGADAGLFIGVSDASEIWCALERDRARWLAAFDKLRMAVTATLTLLVGNEAMAILIVNDIFDGQAYPGGSEIVYQLSNPGCEDLLTKKELVHKNAMEILEIDSILQLVVESSLYLLHFELQEQGKDDPLRAAGEGLFCGWALTQYSTGKLLDIDTYEEFVSNYERVARKAIGPSYPRLPKP